MLTIATAISTATSQTESAPANTFLEYQDLLMQPTNKPLIRRCRRYGVVETIAQVVACIDRAIEALTLAAPGGLAEVGILADFEVGVFDELSFVLRVCEDRGRAEREDEEEGLHIGVRRWRSIEHIERWVHSVLEVIGEPPLGQAALEVSRWSSQLILSTTRTIGFESSFQASLFFDAVVESCESSQFGE